MTAVSAPAPVYRGVRMVITPSRRVFVPRLKRASVYPSITKAMEAIDQGYNSGALR